MREADPPHVRWHKSSYSSASGQCVEVASVAGAVVVRDSKNLAGPELVFTRQCFVLEIAIDDVADGGRIGKQQKISYERVSKSICV